KRENYVEMHEVYKMVNVINDMASNKRAAYMQHAYIICAYVAEFQALNGMRIGELLAIQLENIDFENKKLTIDGTIRWERRGTEYRFKDTTKNEDTYRTISITSRSVESLKKIMIEAKKLKQWEDQYQERGFLFT